MYACRQLDFFRAVRRGLGEVTIRVVAFRSGNPWAFYLYSETDIKYLQDSAFLADLDAFFCPFVEFIASINEDISLAQKRQQRVYQCVHRGSRLHPRSQQQTSSLNILRGCQPWPRALCFGVREVVTTVAGEAHLHQHDNATRLLDILYLYRSAA